MSEASLNQRLLLHGAFVALCTGFVFLRLLPLDTVGGGLPGPDLMLCLAIAWAIRRPDLVPVWLVAPVFFLADMLMMRPPGLWTALVIVMTEGLRKRHRRLRTLSFPAELGLVAVIAAGMVAAQWLVLAVLFVKQPALWTQLLQVPMTVAAYPLVVLIGNSGLGVRKRPAPEGFGRGAGA